MLRRALHPLRPAPGERCRSCGRAHPPPSYAAVARALAQRGTGHDPRHGCARCGRPMPAAVRASVYARYSSENQRRENIEDQVLACRSRGQAEGLRRPRGPDLHRSRQVRGDCHPTDGLIALCDPARERSCDVVLVDDLSRLEYNGVRNRLRRRPPRHERRTRAARGSRFAASSTELLLSDLRKRTFRGQLGQKDAASSLARLTCSRFLRTTDYWRE